MKKHQLIILFGIGLGIGLGPLSVQAYEIQARSKPCCCCASHKTQSRPCCQLKPGPSWDLLANSQEFTRSASFPSAGPVSFNTVSPLMVRRTAPAKDSPPGPAPNLASPPSNRAPPAA